jgi:hypothetical protein
MQWARRYVHTLMTESEIRCGVAGARVIVQQDFDLKEWSAGSRESEGQRIEGVW